MNDPNESEYLWRKYIEKAGELSERNRRHTEETYDRGFSTVMYMSFSLSKYSDSSFMWQKYAKGGKGVAIGFDEDGLDAWRKNIRGSYNGPCEPIDYAAFHDVIYPSDSELDVISEHLNRDEVDDVFAGLFPSYDIAPMENHMIPVPKIGFPNYGNIVVVSPFVKRKAYEREGERRILITLYPEGGDRRTYRHTCEYLPDGDGGEHVSVDMEWRGNDYSTHYPFFSIPFKKDMIREVRLGPRCICDERYVRLMLQNHGYGNIEI